MLEEKEVLTDEEIVEESVSEALAEAEMDKGPVDDEKDVKNALVSFILAAVDLAFFWTPVVSIVLSAISMGILKKIKGTVEKKPHAIFMKITKPLSLVELIVGIVATLGWLIWLIVVIVMAIIALVTGAASAASDAAMSLL